MKKSKFNFTFFTLTILLGFIIGCEQQATRVNVEADITKIKDGLKQYADAVNSGDFEIWISLWDNDGVQMPPNAPPIEGKEKIMEGNKSDFEKMNLEINHINIEEIQTSGELGFSRCSYTLAVSPKTGGEKIIVEPDGKDLAVWKRQSDGSWKILYDCFNSNVPPKQE
jgi:ketosteroid isomerase-like protein